MTIEEYALKLKQMLQKNPSQSTINEILTELSNKRYTDGTKLSKNDINKILDIIQYERTSNGSILLKDSDNSAFLKAVSVIKSSLSDGDKE